MSANDPFYRHEDELALLGCLLDGDQPTANDILDTVRAEKLTHQLVIDALAVARSLAADGANIDAVTVGGRWAKVHGRNPNMSDLSDALGKCIVASNWTLHWADILDAASRRSLRVVAATLSEEAGDPMLAIAETRAKAEQALMDEVATENKVLTAKEASKRLIDDLQRRQALYSSGGMSGISYGFRRLDGATSGLQQGELVIVGARPSVGKTAFGISMMAKMAVQNEVPCCFVSLETDDIGLNHRLMANLSSVPLRNLRDGNLTDAHQRAVVAWIGRIAKAPIHEVNGTGGMDGLAVASIIRRMARRHGVRVVFLDYVQKMRVSGNAEKRTYGIAENLAQVVSATKGTGVATVALAQLNREAEGVERRPSLKDLAESGQIERDADTILFLHRDRMVPSGPAEVVIAKARDGECGVVSLNYNGPFTRFEDGAGPDMDTK